MTRVFAITTATLTAIIGVLVGLLLTVGKPDVEPNPLGFRVCRHAQSDRIRTSILGGVGFEFTQRMDEPGVSRFDRLVDILLRPLL